MVVEEWLGAEPERREGLRVFARVWWLSQAPGSPGGWEALEARIDQLEAWRARRSVHASPEPVRLTPRRSHPSWRAPLRAAAVLLVGLGLGLIWPSLSATLGTEQYAKVVVPAGSRVELELPGGVGVRLNSATELSYLSSRDVREVYLEGEAYFVVPEGAKRNLLVHTEAGLVRDLGTEFNVRARSGRTAVVVAEGRVALETTGGRVALEAGEESSMAIGAAPSAPVLANLDRVNGWMAGRLVFYEESLAEVAAELERHYGIAVRVAPPLQEVQLAVNIDAHTESGAAVRLVCQAVDARCEEKAGAWTVQVKR
jgi:ferric-dicitrate binding protein FerR (iron transport regulator)